MKHSAILQAYMHAASRTPLLMLITLCTVLSRQPCMVPSAQQCPTPTDTLHEVGKVPTHRERSLPFPQCTSSDGGAHANHLSSPRSSLRLRLILTSTAASVASLSIVALYLQRPLHRLQCPRWLLKGPRLLGCMGTRSGMKRSGTTSTHSAFCFRLHPSLHTRHVTVQAGERQTSCMP